MKASSEEMGWRDDNKEPEGSLEGRGTEMQISRGEGGQKSEGAADGAGDRRREGADDGQSVTVRGGGVKGEEATPPKEKAE